ncbi:DDE-type integrase/transposase/recombinase [Micromonospora sp. KC207]|uniref:DDE-type integrase/transposase/recombinase n=1 Tax=Micromonospora sp. KC207 TaxID=2530377 RepID=UPI001A9DD842|nr:DDE-type integrase/transposase/recombinase [Micromonospora sp. KC207]
MLPSARHHIERHANNPIEADHSQLKHRLRPMRGLRTDRTAHTIITGHAFVPNPRRGHHELATDAPPATRVATAFTEPAQATRPSPLTRLGVPTDPPTQQRRRTSPVSGAPYGCGCGPGRGAGTGCRIGMGSVTGGETGLL